MVRYIDADNLIAQLKDEIEGCKPPFSGRANGKGVAYGTMLGLKMAISFAETLSTADVAPKSEVEQLQHKYDLAVAEREANVKGFAEELSKAKTEVERLTVEIEAELKLKYADLQKERDEYKKHVDNDIIYVHRIRAEVAMEIFEEIYEDCFDQFGYINYEALAELKKKYTEDPAEDRQSSNKSL